MQRITHPLLQNISGTIISLAQPWGRVIHIYSHTIPWSQGRFEEIQQEIPGVSQLLPALRFQLSPTEMRWKIQRGKIPLCSSPLSSMYTLNIWVSLPVIPDWWHSHQTKDSLSAPCELFTFLVFGTELSNQGAGRETLSQTPPNHGEHRELQQAGHCAPQGAGKAVSTPEGGCMFALLRLTFSIFSSSILKNSCWLSEMCMLEGKGTVSVPTGLFPL